MLETQKPITKSRTPKAGDIVAFTRSKSEAVDAMIREIRERLGKDEWLLLSDLNLRSRKDIAKAEQRLIRYLIRSAPDGLYFDRQGARYGWFEIPRLNKPVLS